jgi:hypothetical protein
MFGTLGPTANNFEFVERAASRFSPRLVSDEVEME